MKRKICLLLLIFALLSSVFVFSSCKKKEIEALYRPSNVTYDGARIVWERVPLAEYYKVSINQGEKKKALTNFFNFDSNWEEFDVEIFSVIEGKEYGTTMHFTPLDKIESFTVSDSGEITWEEVVGATAYRISVNGNIQATDLTEARFTPASGNNRIKVRPVVSGNNGFYSDWSDEKSIYVNYEPTAIAYDGELLSWTGNSSSYEVIINGNKQIVTGSSIPHNSNNQDFNVQIKSIGDHVYSFDSKQVEKTFFYLAPVTNLSVSDGTLSWSPSENADGYQLKINGSIQKNTVTSTVYDKLPVGASLVVEIKPYKEGDSFFSSWSKPENIYILETPTTSWNADLELDGEANNNFIWNAVPNATGYEVEVEKDGFISKSILSSSQVAFAHAFSDTGVYKIRVKALIANNAGYYDSRFSKDVVIERLAAPTPASTTYINSDPSFLSKGFTVNYKAVSGASGYQLYKEGALLEGKFSTNLSISDEDVMPSLTTTQQEYNYYVRSMGSVKNVSGTTYVYLPCLTSKALSFKITIMATPTNLTMSGFLAKWTGTEGNNGYSLSYAGTLLYASSTQQDLSSLKTGSYEIAVCSNGNGSNVLASPYTAPINIERIKAPTNVNISYGLGEGQLNFDGVTNAKSYQVFLDQSEQALPENAYDNMYQFIKEEGSVLYMISVANYFNDNSTVYYMTSVPSPTQQFIRLATPSFPENAFSNSIELIWNEPSNINSAEYTPTYEVYESNTMQTGGAQNSTKFNIEYLQGGKAYTFRIKAVGNDSKYLDSELSSAITVYKLATPTITIKNNCYVWNGVTNATSYALEIDGVRVDNQLHVAGKTYSFAPNFTEIGEHIVKLYAVGDGVNNVNSSAFIYNQKVQACLAPDVTCSYSEEQFVTGGSIIVKITTPSANASGYLYEIAGSSSTSTQLQFSKQIESTGSYFVRVKALGSTFDENGTYYIDSPYSGGGSGYTVILLAHPTLSSFSINSDGAVKWATITDAIGYDYQISYDNSEYSSISHTGTATLNPIANFNNYKTIKIKVRASGNGSSIISSQWIEFVWNNPDL